MEAILIPEASDEPVRVIEIGTQKPTLTDLQEAVGGYVEALPFPDRDDVTCYIHDEGKYLLGANPRATKLLESVLFVGDTVHGPLVVCGFDSAKGETLTVPDDVVKAILPAEAGGMGTTDGLGA